MLAGAALGPGAHELAAQRRDLTADASLQREPRGTVLAELPAGAPVEPGRTRGDWREATIEGWIFTRSLARTSREGFDLVVDARGGENLRAEPNGRIIARLRTGTLLHKVSERGGWTKVRRTGWIARGALRPPPRTPPDTGRSERLGAQSAAQAPARQTPARQAQAQPTRVAAAAPAGTQPASPPPATAATPDANVERIEAARETGLYLLPDSQRVGTIQPGAGGRIVARSGDWVRVQIDGWVRESDLKASGGPLAITGAELRADPDKYVGATVDWRLQVIAVQVADELRTEMPQGQPYLLARGPLPEPGFVYVMIPQAEMDRFRALPPLQEVVLRVVIRAPRTRYLATPVVELVEARSGVAPR